MRAPRLLLVDFLSYGHHGQYILQLVDYWLDNSIEGTLAVVVPQPMVALHPRLERIAHEHDCIRLVKVSETTGLQSEGNVDQLLNIRKYGLLLRRYIELLRPDHCLLMYFDQAQLPLALRLRFRFPVRISGIYFRPSFHYPRLTRIRTTLTDRMVALRKRVVLRAAMKNRHFHTLFSLDPYAIPFISAPRHASVVHLADGIPVAASNSGSEPLLDLEDGRQTALFFGSIARRKGIFETLTALSLLSPLCQKRLCLVIAGRVPEEVRSAIASATGGTGVRIITLDRYLPDEEVSTLFAETDLVLVPYPRHVGSSGILVRAAAAGKPVLGSDYGLVGANIRHHQLGRTVDATDPACLADALSEWLVNPGSITVAPQSAADFAAAHTAESYCRTILGALTLYAARAK